MAAAVTWASMTKMRAPQPPNMWSESKAGSRKSIWPGKSHIYMVDIYREGGLVRSCQLPTHAVPSLSKPLPFLLPFFPHTHSHTHTWNWTKELLLMSSLTTLLVLSRKRVSLGDSLWNTTFEMDDFPLLQKTCTTHTPTPSLTHHHSHPHTITHTPSPQPHLRRPISTMRGLLSLPMLPTAPSSSPGP